MLVGFRSLTVFVTVKYLWLLVSTSKYFRDRRFRGKRSRNDERARGPTTCDICFDAQYRTAYPVYICLFQSGIERIVHEHGHPTKSNRHCSHFDIVFTYNRYPQSLARETPFFAYFPVTELTGTQNGTKSVTFFTGIVWSCLPSNRTKIDVLVRETRVLPGKIITGTAQVSLPLCWFSYDSR